MIKKILNNLIKKEKEKKIWICELLIKWLHSFHYLREAPGCSTALLPTKQHKERWKH